MRIPPGLLPGMADGRYNNAHLKTVLSGRPQSCVVRRVEGQSSRPAADYALGLLQRLVEDTKRVLELRGWHVGLLKEFYPKNPQLLGMNVNYGQTILIRLRLPGRDSAFLDYEDILETMLHELAHNDIGKHDESFFALLEELRFECAAARGTLGFSVVAPRGRDPGTLTPVSRLLSGSGAAGGPGAAHADAPAAGPARGVRLGATSKARPTPGGLSARQMAAAAALRRFAATTGSAPSGRRLGGPASEAHARSPAMAAAAAAARARYGPPIGVPAPAEAECCSADRQAEALGGISLPDLCALIDLTQEEADDQPAGRDPPRQPDCRVEMAADPVPVGLVVCLLSDEEDSRSSR
ncbi:hypothetical protein H696_06034 [Fonticula alba]|uniref:WLM domain-containing protein n=1 Tax=Fonticula alba TaxID=691883 RepID=A0A058YZW8_FONAL|nr:hypothetical protein H696_06034 [Fonticula alba]KCV67515.1 hypothetical protein H696_06034 [Fonticula alba]|eukprot:XP_009498076.1 hypothetical protein H696_06034 [Fonticula alba]